MPGKGHTPGSHSGMLLRSIGADAWRSGSRGCVAEFLDLGFAPWHGLDSRCGTLLCIAPIIHYGPARAIAQDRIEFPGTRNPTGGQVPRMRKSAMSKGRAGGSSGWCRLGATLWRSSCERCGERASNVAGGEDGLLDAPQARSACGSRKASEALRTSGSDRGSIPTRTGQVSGSPETLGLRTDGCKWRR